MLTVYSLVIPMLFCIGNGHSGLLPSYIKPCDFDNSNIGECIKVQMEATLPHFTKGIPELSVPSLDPIKLDDIKIDGNGLKLTFTEGELHGLSDSKITDFKLDIGKDVETFSLAFKGNMTLTAHYVVDGRILILPIQGKGDSRVKCQNIEVHIDSKLTHFKQADGTHFKLISPSYKYDILSTTFEFDNLFNGNKQLADATHQFANQNWKQLMDDLAPPVVKQIVRTGVKSINKFFAKITIKEMVHNYKEN